MIDIIPDIASFATKSIFSLNPNQEKEDLTEKRFKISTFQSDEVKANFHSAYQSKVDNTSVPSDPSSETLWKKLKTAILQISVEILGFPLKKNKNGLIKKWKFKNC